MTIHDRLPNEHFVEYRHTYFARCSCGWISPALEGQITADAYFRLHVATAHPALAEAK